MGVMEGHTVEEIKEKFQDVRFCLFLPFDYLHLVQMCPFAESTLFSQCPDLCLRHPRQLEDLAHHPGYQLQTHAYPV